MAKSVRRMVRTSTNPIDVPKNIREHRLEVMTSVPAGKVVPVAAIPFLREDSGRVAMQMAFQQRETVELLMNSVSVRVQAHFVSFLALDRFQSREDVDRAFAGEPPRPGLDVIPYIETAEAPAPGTSPFYKYLGKHFREDQPINTMYLEGYNQIWNYRAKNRSPDLTLRTRLDDTLAPAFWNHEMFAHIVPTFDAAIHEGEVSLNVLRERLPVQGLFRDTYTAQATTGDINTWPERAFNNTILPSAEAGSTSQYLLAQYFDGGEEGFLPIFAEMQQNGITVSLANLELARKTQAFARLRQQYNQHDDEWIIDMLMAGLTIPDQQWRQPLLLADQMSVFGMAKRYATDGGNLTDSVVNGATMLNLAFRVPRCPMGGVVIVTAEALPDQLFERSRDPFLHANGVEDLPKNLEDMLDPQPIESVPNEYIDLDHESPDGVFGYAPANYQWTHAHPCIGGEYHRPTVDAPFDEDRQRLWAVEVENPTLAESFYICKDIHMKPFVDPTRDAFDLLANGGAAITTLTQFGPALIEASDDYDKVMEKAPKERLPQPE